LAKTIDYSEEVNPTHKTRHGAMGGKKTAIASSDDYGFQAEWPASIDGRLAPD